jgi:hypothetical protein
MNTYPNKITEIFCVVDNFCMEFAVEFKKLQIQSGDAKRHRNRSLWMSESEIITILLLFHFGTFHNFKHFIFFISGNTSRKNFPNSSLQSFCGN